MAEIGGGEHQAVCAWRLLSVGVHKRRLAAQPELRFTQAW